MAAAERDVNAPVADGESTVLLKLLKHVNWRIASTVGVLAVLSIVFDLTSDGIFFDPRNLSLLLRQASLVAILAAGVSILMIMAEIDLSIGGCVLLTGAVAAKLSYDYGIPTWVCVVAALAAGGVLGAWNGFWVVRLGVPSFVVTLGGLLGFAGLTLLWTNAATVGPLPTDFVDLSEAFIPKGASYAIVIAIGVALVVMALRRHQVESRRHGAELAGLAVRLAAIAVTIGLMLWITGGYQGLPAAVVWVFAVGAVFTFIAVQAKFGRNAFMIGANREAAHLAGIRVGRHIFIGFVLMGMLGGVQRRASRRAPRVVQPECHLIPGAECDRGGGHRRRLADGWRRDDPRCHGRCSIARGNRQRDEPQQRQLVPAAGRQRPDPPVRGRARPVGEPAPARCVNAMQKRSKEGGFR